MSASSMIVSSFENSAGPAWIYGVCACALHPVPLKESSITKKSPGPSARAHQSRPRFVMYYNEAHSGTYAGDEQYMRARFDERKNYQANQMYICGEKKVLINTTLLFITPKNGDSQQHAQ